MGSQNRRPTLSSIPTAGLPSSMLCCMTWRPTHAWVQRKLKCPSWGAFIPDKSNTCGPNLTPYLFLSPCSLTLISICQTLTNERGFLGHHTPMSIHPTISSSISLVHPETPCRAPWVAVPSLSLSVHGAYFCSVYLSLSGLNATEIDSLTPPATASTLIRYRTILLALEEVLRSFQVYPLLFYFAKLEKKRIERGRRPWWLAPWGRGSSLILHFQCLMWSTPKWTVERPGSAHRNPVVTSPISGWYREAPQSTQQHYDFTGLPDKTQGDARLNLNHR